MVTDHLAALLQGLCPSDIKTYGSIELQSTSTSRCLRVAKHNTNLFTELIDKDYHTVRTAYCCSKFTKCLRHQTCMKTYMTVSHIPLDLCLRNQCCNRVYNYDVNCTGTYHRLGDFKCLLTVIRL